MMKYKEKIKQICQDQTDLEQNDIEYLVSKADELLQDSLYVDDDVFIDVKNVYADNNAIVIFHKRPQVKDSLYERPVVGEEAHLQNEPGVIRTLQTGMPSIGLSALSQEGIAIYQTVYPILRENRVIGTLIVERDTTSLPTEFFLKKKSVEDSYGVVEEDSPQRFSYFDYIDDAVLVFDKKGYLLYSNKPADNVYCKQLGYKDSIKEMHYANLVLDNVHFENIWSIYQKEQVFEKSVDVQYGSYFFSIKRQVIDDGKALLMVCKDITDMKKIESQVTTHVTSLREMNHRVKNNLQTVVSLLRLQAQRSASPEAKKSLYDGVNRILSIATMHDLLASGYENQILVETLLRRVAENVQRAFVGQADIQVIYEIGEGILLDSNRATSLALIVNELLQNSYDHAFQKNSQKNPRIRLQFEIKNNIMKLRVIDNGSGYDVKKQPIDNHLGLLLVSRFVQSKLSGTLRIHSDSSGTSTIITFKNE